MSPHRCTIRCSLALTLAALPAAAQNQLWIRQFGTSNWDSAYAAAADGSGGAYVSGVTYGGLGGPNAGFEDAWFARYDGAGSALWIRQLGTSNPDHASAAAADGFGGAYVCGSTGGSLSGPNAGSDDAWLARYDGAGNQLWIRQFGSGNWDNTYAAAADGSGGVYVGGSSTGGLGGPNAGSYDAWLARYDGAGNQQWIRQLGTSGWDFVHAAAPDGAGGVYVGGATTGSLGGSNAGSYDFWLAHFDGAGNQQWIRQLGTSADDAIFATALDGSGGVVASGITGGSLGGPNAGGHDAWLAHYDSAGNLQWIRQFGSSATDGVASAAPGGSGSVYVSGSTLGNLGGSNAGGDDVWLAHYDHAGNQQWIRQLGTGRQDRSHAAAPDGSGGVYVGGITEGNLGSPSAGDWDAWLARFDDAGCPTPAIYCTAQVSSSGCLPSIAFSGTPSLAAPGAFSVIGSSLEASRNGIMFFGTTGPSNMPFGGGILCVNPPLYRLNVKNSGATAPCAGTLSYTLQEMLAQPQGGPLLVVNQATNIQTWFRDPNHPSTTGLSNGLQFMVCP